MDINPGVVIALAAFGVMALIAVLVAVISAVATTSGLHSTNDEDSEA